MHFCRFNLEFVGLGYKPNKCIGDFSFVTFELYRCKKCGKLIFENKNVMDYATIQYYKQAIANTQACGYKPLGELVKE